MIGTRLISFLLLPLYTYCIHDPGDYGYFDICLSLCLMLVPVVTLQMREGAFRFMMATAADDDVSRRQIATVVYQSLATSIGATLLIALAMGLTLHIRLFWPTVAMLVTFSIHEVVAQMCRGLKRNDVYVQGNIACALVTAVVSAILLLVFHGGVESIFWANVLGHVAGIGLCEARARTLRLCLGAKVDTKTVRKELLRYCLPMIPLTLCWWMTVNSDRLLIKHFLGLDSNGVYAVAMRFSAVIHALALIFYQTWQESAITQFKSKDRDAYYSRVYNVYIFALASIFILYVFLLKLNIGWLVADAYRSCLPLIFPLGLASVLSALSSSFFDPIYQSAGNTRRAVPAVVLTACLSVGLNFVLLPVLQLPGACLTAILAYGFLLIYRLIDTRRYVKLHITAAILIPVAVMALAAIPYYASRWMMVDVASMVVAVAVIGLSFVIYSRKHHDKGEQTA